RHWYLRAAEEYLAATRLASGTLQAESALALAATYYGGLQDWARAAQWAARARDLAQKAGLAYPAARAGTLLAAAWIEAPAMQLPDEAPGAADPHERLERARAELAQLEAFHRRRGEHRDAAEQRLYRGVAFFNESAFDRAEQEFRAALRGFAALHESAREGVAWQDIATCEWGRGELSRAERTFRLAEPLLAASPYPQPYLLELSNHAMVSHALGELDQALRLETRALALAERLEAPIPTGLGLHGLGMTYYALGDRDQSRYYLERAVTFHTPDSRSYVSTLRALATVYREEGRPADSQRLAREALRLATSAAARARVAVGLARDDAALGHRAEAQAALDAVLAGSAGRYATIRVDALLARSELRLDGGDLDGALADLGECRALLASLEDPEDEFQVHLATARVYHRRGQPSEALAAVDRALRLAGVLRRKTADPALRAQRQEPLRPAFDLKIAVLVDLGAQAEAAGRMAEARERQIEALAVAEASRARSLADLEAQSLAVSDPALGHALARRAELYRDIAARQFQLDARRDTAGDDDARARRYQAEIAGLRRELDVLSADLGRRGAGRAESGRPAPLAWSAWLAAHAPDTALIEYWVGARTTWAWTVTGQGISFHALGPSDAVTAAARSLHGAMRDVVAAPLARRLGAAQAVYETTLAPLEAQLGAHRRWIVVPDRALGFVPYPALRVARGGRPHYLVEEHDVAVAPAAWWLFRAAPAQPAPAAGDRILIVADPVYGSGDARLPRDVAARGRTELAAEREWPRLPFSAREADNIAALFPAQAVERLEGLAATREHVLAAPLGDFRYLHFASHGYADARSPELSAIVLGAFDEHGAIGDRTVRPADLAPLRLRADVVTLSACDTALGREVAGEGVMGLAYTALARGARAVVASLWPVSDEMAVTVMTEFYRGLRGSPDAPAALGRS
ncbi:MAG: CHAT domain-containing protein, partial [Proteobacteria bacterium]|nr:CHAT domain-containing protein [Pseudomonadota bacterium]